MSEKRNEARALMAVTPAMKLFIDYFGDLGPRWGVASDTSRANALLYLAGRPLGPSDVAAGLGIPGPTAARALADLRDWGMARAAGDGCWRGGGDPWDLLFRALESRQRREIAPALEALRACKAEAAADGETPGEVGRRIADLLTLIEDLAAINTHSRHLPRNLLPGIVRAAGGASRLIDRVLPGAPTRWMPPR